MLTSNTICGNKNFSTQNSLLYLISEAIGRTGKGYYLTQYKNWLKNNNIPTTKWSIDRTYTDNRYSTNLVAIGEEWTPVHTDAMNDIIDNVDYACRQKYEREMIIPSRITGVIATNYQPSDSNTVRFGKVIFNHYSYDDYRADHESHTPTNYDELFTTCLLTVPTTPYKVDKVNRDARYDEYVLDHFTEAYNNDMLDKNKLYTLSGLMKSITLDDTLANRNMLKAFLLKNRNKGIKVYKNHNYRLSTYTDVLAINSTNNPNLELDEIKEDIETCLKEWDKILKELKPQDPNDPTNNLRYVKDTYDKELTKDSKDKEYICTAKYTTDFEQAIVKGSTPDRKSEHLTPTFFVYESDTLPLEEQKELINKSNKDNIYTATFSGSKSVHYLVPIQQSQANEIKKDFKYYWKKAGELVFNEAIMKEMDSNCASIGRLSRNPNAYRTIGNAMVKQDLLYQNDNVEPIDLSQIIIEHNKELKSKKDYVNVKILVNKSLTSQYPSQQVNKKDKNYLEHCYKKNHNENVGLALQVLNGKTLPSGSNLIGITSMLKQMNIDVELRKHIITLLKQQHPTNLPKKVEDYL